MADEPTAALFAERLRSNDVANEVLSLDRPDWDAMGQWTASACREVVDAAKHNTSIRTLGLTLCPMMSEEAVDLFSYIVGHLDHVENVRVCDFLEEAGEGEEAPPPDIVDRLLTAITRSRSDVRSLHIFQCNSPRAFLKFAERFPRLHTLEITGPCPEFEERSGCASVNDFAVSVSAAIGRLSSLRTVRFDWRVVHTCIPVLFSGLHTSSSVKALDVSIPANADEVVLSASHYCCVTKTLEAFVCRGQNMSEDEFLDMSSFFNIGPLPSFAPTIKEVQFFLCRFDDHAEDADELIDRAAKALKNVESLRLGMCHFSAALKVLGRLPCLKRVSCLSRPGLDKPYEAIGEGEAAYEPVPYLLEDNDDLVEFCDILEQQGSSIEEVELDLVGRDPQESYPAIVRLLQACRGSLVLNCGDLPWRSYLHILSGAERIRPDLKQLRLRFCSCAIDDASYAEMIHAFGSNKTLALFEIGFDPNVGFEDLELAISAFREIVETNNTLQTLSLRGPTSDDVAIVLEQILPVLCATNRSLRVLELHDMESPNCWPRFAGPVLDMLKENYVLSKLEGFKIPEADPAAALLKQNRYGRRFLQPNDPSPIGIWTAVLARISKDGERGLMYTFLRAKPGLVVRSPDLPPRGRRTARKRGRSVGQKH
jgi:hypothetical protein